MTGNSRLERCHGAVFENHRIISFNIASEASYVYILSGQNLINMPKIVHFVEFLKTWSELSNSVTRQVSFNRTKIGGKIPKLKNIKCDILSNFQTMWGDCHSVWKPLGKVSFYNFVSEGWVFKAQIITRQLLNQISHATSFDVQFWPLLKKTKKTPKIAPRWPRSNFKWVHWSKAFNFSMKAKAQSSTLVAFSRDIHYQK